MSANQQDPRQRRLATAILDQMLTDAIAREQQRVADTEQRLRHAKKALRKAQRDRRQWRRKGTLDRHTEIEALAVAQIADLVPSDVPRNAHHEAVREFLVAHDPPRA